MAVLVPLLLLFLTAPAWPAPEAASPDEAGDGDGPAAPWEGGKGSLEEAVHPDDWLGPLPDGLALDDGAQADLPQDI